MRRLTRRLLPWLQPAASDMAGRCLAGRPALFSLAEAAAAGGSLFTDEPPSGGALGRRLALNTPERPIATPLFIAQGLADELVLPDIQALFVARRCAAGQALEYATYTGRDHLSVLAADSPLNDALLRWTEQRLDGTPATPGCRETKR